MAAAPGPLPDEEFVYRRIAWRHYANPTESPYPRIDAFLPRKDEMDGLSVDRARLTEIDRTRRGRSTLPYHVARLSVGELRRKLGLVVVPEPTPADPRLGLPDNPAHALIPGLSRAVYEQDKAAFRAMIDVIIREIAELVLVALDPTIFSHHE